MSQLTPLTVEVSELSQDEKGPFRSYLDALFTNIDAIAPSRDELSGMGFNDVDGVG